MSADPTGALPAIDPAVLAGVLRQQQRDPDFAILDWAIGPLNHETVIDTTGGLFLLTGTGRSGRGAKPWSVVLKIFNNPKVWAQDPSNWAYWPRELLVYQSGLLAGLPAGVSAPRCYGASDNEDNGWIWMEHIEESPRGRWSMERFRSAAHHAGLFDSAFLAGAPLPDAPWLCPSLFRSINADGDFWANHMNPASPGSTWQSPLLQRAFNNALAASVVQIWTDKHRFWDAADRLPQVFCHNDFFRRNLMFRVAADGQEELVALDWSRPGPGALGMDLGQLVGTSAQYFDIEPAEVGEVEAAVLDGYLAGLQDGGWSGDPRLARLGYLLGATWRVAALPGWVPILLADKPEGEVLARYDRSVGEVLKGWVTLTEFLLGRVDEARWLMGKLDLA